MTYEAILDELNEVQLKEQFQSLFESLIRPQLLEKVKTNNRLYSIAAAVRYLLGMMEDENSQEYLFWVKVLNYFRTPKFARTGLEVPSIK